MPYKNEHAFRIKEPEQFDSFSRKNNEFGAGIHVIYGIKDNKSTVQSIRFATSKFTFQEAKDWMKSHDWTYIKAEEATGNKAYTVKCGACGVEFDYLSEPENHMGTVACPDCGSTVDQEGKVHKTGNKNIFNRLIRRFYNGINK